MTVRAASGDLPERYQRVTERVAAAAERAGRSASDVLVVAVTKLAAPDQIRHLLELGHQDLGENRVQQLSQRVAMTEEFVARHQSMLSPRKTQVPETVRWHMVGHLQRNKVKAVMPLVKLIHSVDSLRLAEELQAQAARCDVETDALLQVNASGEKSKYGVVLSAAPHLADQMQTMFNVRLRGLMTMAPYSDNPENARPTFQRTAEVFSDMKDSGAFGEKFNILSMGMSDDYEVAIECGSNVVRLGRTLFGEAAEPQR
jgi:pyridoxal phosphate enzyme (YggS family)